MRTLAALHAQHIFDFDATSNTTSVLALSTFMANTTTEQSTALLMSFLSAALALPGISLVEEEHLTVNINDALFEADDSVGDNLVLGSRLIPASTFRDAPATVGKVYEELLDAGTLAILGHLVAGGQVAANANISSAVHPAWRTAKTHLIVVNLWTDATPLADVKALRNKFQITQLPIMEQISGPNAGAYSNEADVLEPNFRTTFFGPNYAKLSGIKRKYDPADLFIVPAGVGSERWDQWGLCTV
ncbi:hypothetical protein DFH09DRAFT_1394555 [Mycena vulgaris]|nr:hypothetical protein DFH09DRAFT_1394555 [Mycena vulgaris]